MEAAGECSFEASPGFALGSAFGDSPVEVAACFFAALGADEDDGVEGGVGLSVAAAVEPVPGGLA